MLLVQILAIVVLVGLIAIALLAFIEPGPLNRRSRDRGGRRPEDGPERDGRRNPD